MSELSGLSVVIPVHKESRFVVESLYNRLTSLGADVVIVDDGATMDITVPYKLYYPHMGYGYAIKYGIRYAKNNTVLTMDGDSQHTVEDAVKLYKVYKTVGDIKMIVGQRWNLNEKPIRWIARKFLNFIASCISGHYLSDLNSGMRVFDKSIAIGYSPILCDTFSFTTSFTMAMITDRHKTMYVPINVQPRSHGKSHVKLFRDGLITLYYIVWVGLALRTRGPRAWLRSLFGR